MRNKNGTLRTRTQFQLIQQLRSEEGDIGSHVHFKLRETLNCVVAAMSLATRTLRN